MNALENAAGLGMPLGWSLGAALAGRHELRTIAPNARDDAPSAFLLAAAAGVGAVVLDAGPESFLRAGACSALCGAALVDARIGLLPDRILVPATFATLVLALVSGQGQAAAFGSAVLALPAATLILLSRGRLLGWGDVKALLMVGSALGPERGALALAAACACGAFLALTMLALRGALERVVPFGPFLVAGMLAALAPGDLFLRSVGL